MQAKVFLVPSPPNPNFVNRSDVFRELYRAVEKSKERTGNSHVILCGLGGTGKTEIALEYCHRNRETYQYIFWIDADTESAVQSSFVYAASMLGLPVLATLTSANPECVVPCFIQWLQSNSGWLLIFDNADDYSLGNPSDYFYLQRRYFPKTNNGVILITTRNNSKGQEALVINLDDMKMNDEVALKLLLRRNTTIADVDPFAIEIVRELGHLPLAIDLAGACMTIERLSPYKFLIKYKEDQAGYLNLEDIQKQTGNTYGKTVLTVWSVSFDRISKNNPLAARLLQSFAFLYFDDIPFVLFERHAQRILGLPDTPLGRSLNVAVNHLSNFSLVRRTFRDNVDDDNPAKDTLSIHRLVQKVILLQVELPERLLMCERLMSALNFEVPSEFRLYDEHFRKIMEVYVPHVQHIIGQYTLWAIGQSTVSNELTSLLLLTVAYLVQQGLFEGVESLDMPTAEYDNIFNLILQQDLAISESESTIADGDASEELGTDINVGILQISKRLMLYMTILVFLTSVWLGATSISEVWFHKYFVCFCSVFFVLVVHFSGHSRKFLSMSFFLSFFFVWPKTRG